VADFDAVLFAGTAGALSKLSLLNGHVPNLSTFSKVYYPPVASVVLGFRREDVAHALDGFGVLVPEVEGFNILGTLFSSSLFPNRAPAGHVLLTSYLGGARNPNLALQDPEDLVQMTQCDLEKLLGVRGRPTFEHHFVFPKAIPQYEVGYGRFKKLMNDIENSCPGFFLAGHFRDGISLGDSIMSGHDVAARILDFLKKTDEKNLPAAPFEVAA
jgi:oxygen-dependent protoporphyrinogen oxidase